MRFKIGFLSALVVVLLPVFAQAGPRVGVSGGLLPSWKMPAVEPMTSLIGSNAVNYRGDEFRFGIVLGKPQGGFWGVEFVQKRFKNANIDDRRPNPEAPDGMQGTLTTLDGVQLTGGELFAFVPFKTIKKRVQIGMNFGLGVAKIKGEALQTTTYYKYGEYTPGQPQGKIWLTKTRTVPAEEGLFGGFPVAPIFRLELATALILPGGLKLQASGGLNFPAAPAIGVTLIWFPGAK